MHEIRISPDSIAKVTRRSGRQHPYDTLDPRKAALVVIDMQNHFMAPGFMAETPTARESLLDVEDAIREFQHRERRFGMTTKQIQKKKKA